MKVRIRFVGKRNYSIKVLYIILLNGFNMVNVIQGKFDLNYCWLIGFKEWLYCVGFRIGRECKSFVYLFFCCVERVVIYIFGVFFGYGVFCFKVFKFIIWLGV